MKDERDERKDLELYGSIWLKKVSRLLVGNTSVFSTVFAKNIFRSEYTVKRYLKRLPINCLLDDYDLLRDAVSKTLDCCLSSDEFNSELIKKNREKFEQVLLDELEELHYKAIQWEVPGFDNIF